MVRIFEEKKHNQGSLVGCLLVLLHSMYRRCASTIQTAISLLCRTRVYILRSLYLVYTLVATDRHQRQREQRAAAFRLFVNVNNNNSSSL